MQDVDALIGNQEDSAKMKDALKEMKEFQYYYSAMASPLRVLHFNFFSYIKNACLTRLAFSFNLSGTRNGKICSAICFAQNKCRYALAVAR